MSNNHSYWTLAPSALFWALIGGSPSVKKTPPSPRRYATKWPLLSISTRITRPQISLRAGFASRDRHVLRRWAAPCPTAFPCLCESGGIEAFARARKPVPGHYPHILIGG